MKTTYTVKVHVDADTANDATTFLETFFKLYPTATEKELAYYATGNVLEPIGRDYLSAFILKYSLVYNFPCT